MSVEGYSHENAFEEFVDIVNSRFTYLKLCPSKNFFKFQVTYSNKNQTLDEPIKILKPIGGHYYYKAFYCFKMSQTKKSINYQIVLQIKDGIGVVPKIQISTQNLSIMPYDLRVQLEKILDSDWQNGPGFVKVLSCGDADYTNIQRCFYEAFNCLENYNFKY
ncbi:hypothetical protein D3C71_1141700 [compost metagenome]